MFNPIRSTAEAIEALLTGSDAMQRLIKSARSQPPKSINKTRTRALKGRKHASQKARSNRRKASRK